MQPETTALILIELQNDFTSEGGSLHEAVRPIMESSKMLDNTVTTVNEARARGVTILHVPLHYSDGYQELRNNPYGILKAVVDTQSFRKGSWGAEIVDVLTPSKNDLVIEGKRGLCAFATTNLDFVLRSRGIITFALGGFLTNICIESTMRTGYEKGYDVITLTDCTASLGSDEQRVSVEKNFPMFSTPMLHGEFLAALDARSDQFAEAS